MIYAGARAYWSLGQVANAATKYRQFDATRAGLMALQDKWYSLTSEHPSKAITPASNVAWARAALSDVKASVINYEKVPT